MLHNIYDYALYILLKLIFFSLSDDMSINEVGQKLRIINCFSAFIF